MLNRCRLALPVLFGYTWTYFFAYVSDTIQFEPFNVEPTDSEALHKGNATRKRHFIEKETNFIQTRYYLRKKGQCRRVYMVITLFPKFRRDAVSHAAHHRQSIHSSLVTNAHLLRAATSVSYGNV